MDDLGPLSNALASGEQKVFVQHLHRGERLPAPIVTGGGWSGPCAPPIFNLGASMVPQPPRPPQIAPSGPGVPQMSDIERALLAPAAAAPAPSVYAAPAMARPQQACSHASTPFGLPPPVQSLPGQLYHQNQPGSSHPGLMAPSFRPAQPAPTRPTPVGQPTATQPTSMSPIWAPHRLFTHQIYSDAASPAQPVRGGLNLPAAPPASAEAQVNLLGGRSSAPAKVTPAPFVPPTRVEGAPDALAAPSAFFAPVGGMSESAAGADESEEGGGASLPDAQLLSTRATER